MRHTGIEDAEIALKDAKEAYLRRFGWQITCNLPGAYWMWWRDFAVEDAARHDRWQKSGPGPMGWPGKPKPYGLVTATLDMAVRMTYSALDEDEEEMVER